MSRVVMSLALGCGPSGSSESAEVGDPTSTGTATGTTSGSPAPDTSLDDGTGVGGFVDDPDFGDGTVHDCDPFAQDCPAGFKCIWWDPEGTHHWEDTKCSPIVDEPKAPGEPCVIDGAPDGTTNGIDDCELGAICLGSTVGSSTGHCIAMCTVRGSDHVVCDDPSTFCGISGGSDLALCLPRCSPLRQDCSPGEGCYPWSSDWVCLPDASGSAGAFGEPCEESVDCDPGLVCPPVPSHPACPDTRCCTSLCDSVALPCSGAAAGLSCQLVYDDVADAPPGLEHLGYCAQP